MKKKILSISLIGIMLIGILLLLAGCGIKNEKTTEEVQDTKTNENTIEEQNIVSNDLDSDSDSTEVDNNYAKEYIKIIDEIENKYPDNNITCDLIYFNNDNIPDLVIGLSGYWVSLYLYEDGVVYNPIDTWGYGSMGNAGYEYQEKQGMILNSNSDHAGGIISRSVGILNSKNEFDTLVVTEKGADVEDIEEAKAIEEDLELYGGYFYNEEKISEQEYNDKLQEFSVNIDENNHNILDGTKTTEEIKKQLQQ